MENLVIQLTFVGIRQRAKRKKRPNENFEVDVGDPMPSEHAVTLAGCIWEGSQKEVNVVVERHS